jgi:hypothetical protein
MDGEEIKRRASRKNLIFDIKVRFSGKGDYITVTVKDISTTGLRVISPRLLETGDILEIKMNIGDRQVQSSAKVAWCLQVRPGIGNVSTFDMGLQFQGLKTEDRDLLEKLIEK